MKACGEALSPHAATAAAATAAARASYGRLLAWLAWQWRDIAGAEDALGEAFASALQHWPRDGVPTSPEAWLLTAAKRLVRAKAKIKASGIRFEEPGPEAWPSRVLAVLEAIYGAYVLDASHTPRRPRR